MQVAYLDSLNDLEWSESLKESQRNWIGKSEGAEVRFPLVGGDGAELTVFTTRVDTIYGVTFMVLAPESDYVSMVTTAEQQAAVDEYLAATRRRTERDRLSDRRVSGVFSGSYATNPLTGEAIPIWISDYVLAGYGTGAVMAVPAHDSRDFAFARHFGLPIIQVVVPEGEEATDPATWEESKDSKSGVLINSGIITGLSVPDAIAKMKAHITSEGLGQVKTNYRLRDAIFSRQRSGASLPPSTMMQTVLPILSAKTNCHSASPRSISSSPPPMVSPLLAVLRVGTPPRLALRAKHNARLRW